MNHVKVRDFSQTFYWFLFFTESSFFCTMQETAQSPPGQCIPQHECLHGDEVWGAAAVLTFSPSEQHFVDEWYEALPTVSKLNSRLSGVTYDTFTECLMVGYWESWESHDTSDVNKKVTLVLCSFPVRISHNDESG